MIPEPAAGSASGTAGAPARNQRYTYLIARLRNRQMTMEEATELFALMDAMLRASETARLAMARPSASLPPTPVAAPARPPSAAPAAGTGDDFFLLGIMAMGAGAGLLAAMTKRIQDGGTAPAPTVGKSAAPGSSR